MAYSTDFRHPRGRTFAATPDARVKSLARLAAEEAFLPLPTPNDIPTRDTTARTAPEAGRVPNKHHPAEAGDAADNDRRAPRTFRVQSVATAPEVPAPDDARAMEPDSAQHPVRRARTDDPKRPGQVTIVYARPEAEPVASMPDEHPGSDASPQTSPIDRPWLQVPGQPGFADVQGGLRDLRDEVAAIERARDFMAWSGRLMFGRPG